MLSAEDSLSGCHPRGWPLDTSELNESLPLRLVRMSLSIEFTAVLGMRCTVPLGSSFWTLGYFISFKPSKLYCLYFTALNMCPLHPFLSLSQLCMLILFTRTCLTSGIKALKWFFCHCGPYLSTLLQISVLSPHWCPSALTSGPRGTLTLAYFLCFCFSRCCLFILHFLPD